MGHPREPRHGRHQGRQACRRLPSSAARRADLPRGHAHQAEDQQVEIHGGFALMARMAKAPVSPWPSSARAPACPAGHRLFPARVPQGWRALGEPTMTPTKGPRAQRGDGAHGHGARLRPARRAGASIRARCGSQPHDEAASPRGEEVAVTMPGGGRLLRRGACARACEGAARRDGAVYTLGPLIHNPAWSPSSRLRASGGRDPRGRCRATLCLRTHGVAPEVGAGPAAGLARSSTPPAPSSRGSRRRRAARAARATRWSWWGGGHPEVEGTLGHAPGGHGRRHAPRSLRAELGSAVGVVVRPPMTQGQLDEVVAALVGRVRRAARHQHHLRGHGRPSGAAPSLPQLSDAMVVIGGRNSANTTHLAEI